MNIISAKFIFQLSSCRTNIVSHDIGPDIREIFFFYYKQFQFSKSVHGPCSL